MSTFELTPEEMELFLQEATEQVDTMEELLVTLEGGAGGEALDAIFRAAHTLKGGAATAGMTNTAELTHVLESLLDEIRAGERVADPDTVDALLDAVDWLRTNLRTIEQSGVESDADVTSIIARLQAPGADGAVSGDAVESGRGRDAADVAAEGAGARDEAAATAEGPASEKSEREAMAGDWRQVAHDAAAVGQRVLQFDLHIEAEAPMPSIRLYQALMVLAEHGRLLLVEPDQQEIESGVSDHREMRAVLVTGSDGETVEAALQEVSHLQSVRWQALGVAEADGGVGEGTDPQGRVVADGDGTLQPPAPTEEAAAQPAEPIPGEGVQRAAAPAEAAVQRGAAVGAPPVADTVRVSVQVLDRLMNLVGELVIDRTRLARLGRVELPVQTLREELSHVGDHLSRITTDLQDAIMNARMVPLETLFRRFPRMVRDLSRGLDKQVNFEVVGEDTELDRAVIEHIGDPLVHMIRNAIDHGLESPLERQRAGKPAAGTVTLSAHHRENHIYIEVEDDGRGIDPERVKRSAIDKGLISPEQAAQLIDSEALNLLFLPGFSTSGEVTAVSGRGVGLDVVRRNIERVNGTVSVSSDLGLGTRWTIRLPLTLAIVQALLIGVRESVFAIPLDSVMEIVQIESSEVHTVSGRTVITGREQVIPLINPGEVWGESFRAAWDEEGRNHVVILQGAGGVLALNVDNLIGEQETVIKAIDGLGGQVPGISGASILGDGSVALIIDVTGFTQEVRELGYSVREARRRHDRSA